MEPTEESAVNKIKEYVFTLYGGSDFVDQDGTKEEDEVLFQYKTLGSMNKHLESNYFDMPFDTRSLEFSEETQRLEHKTKLDNYPYTEHLYYIKHELH